MYRMPSITSQKHRQFVGEPMGEKDVTIISGIGRTLGTILTDKGFGKAYAMMGQFLILNKDEIKFKNWLKQICGANEKQQQDCCNCIKGWCESFV